MGDPGFRDRAHKKAEAAGRLPREIAWVCQLRLVVQKA